MPREGYSSVTIPDNLYTRLKALAKDKGLSPAKFLESLLMPPEMEPMTQEVPSIE